MIPAEQYDQLEVIAKYLGVLTDDLYNLIKFESGWNPLAKNPLSSARGLIQFTDKTAQSLGYRDSTDLIAQHPTVQSQLPVVKKYLAQYRPFKTKQSLYMAVFMPAARNLSPDTVFSKTIQNVNPGIHTISDYVRFVEGKSKHLATVVIAVASFFLSKLF